MPVIQPDVSEMTDFEASVPNTYLATIKKVDLKPSKPKPPENRSTKGVNVELVFTAPRLADNEQREVSRYAWLAIEGKGTFNWDQLLRCTGFAEIAEEMKSRPGQVAFDTDALVSRQVNVVLTNGEYNNKLTDNVQSFLPA